VKAALKWADTLGTHLFVNLVVRRNGDNVRIGRERKKLIVNRV
jgi:hypothetical protein